MPILRLRRHQANFSDEDILINQSDFPGLKLRDVVELRPPRNGQINTQQAPSNHDRILLQVRRWPETNQSYPNTVSIKDSVVNNHLKLYADVLVNIVDKKEVLVDSIEICFSNAYLARSYMWGLRNHLNNRCVYQRQKLDYLHIRSQICEIWAQGDKVTSGYVDDDTKIVFRSASSLVYLFIQMSSEMWDYDINGDLYCEKAINGFLRELFDTWRQNDCSHDITIVLFSRTFYDAESLEEFPEEMRECLQVDYKGRFYEDCYRVAFQNDRFDLHDWNVKLTTLKSLFNQYQKEVINRHQEKYLTKIPRAYNSSAAQGNFLEVLNMSLNVFEKHYFDRSFDRTGQLSVVVSPGVGVFEVDFEMTNLTKQRIIDNGIGSDLVCLGEQPLHTVPLLKFNSKSSQLDDNLATCDVYNMPHWINLSFYSSQNQVYYSNFVPRIKLPTLNSTKLKGDSGARAALTTQDQNSANSAKRASKNANDSSNGLDDQQVTTNSNNNNHLRPASGGQTLNSNRGRTSNGGASSGNHHSSNGGPQMSSHVHASATIPDLVDYDEYDAQVFKSNSMVTYCQQQVASRAGVGGGGSGGGHGGGPGDRSILADMDPSRDYLSDECGEDDDEDDGDFLERDNRNKTANIQRRSSDVKNYQEYSRNMKRQASENLPIGISGVGGVGGISGGVGAHRSHNQSMNHHQIQSTFTRMSLVDSYLTDVKIKPESADDLSVRGYNVASSRLSRTVARPKALINPFDPSHMTIKLTPNRRRWTHVFPQGPTGTFIQQHHYQPTATRTRSAKGDLPYLADVSPPTIPECEPLSGAGMRLRSSTSSSMAGGPSSNLLKRRRDPFPVRGPTTNLQQSYAADNTMSTASRLAMGKSLQPNQNQGFLTSTNSKAQVPAANNKSTLVSNDTIRFAWCASGEQVWTPAITTGVDWKSLTMPACLPLTTDFFPSKTSLQNDYVISEYNIDSSFIHSRYTLIEVYRELVCQRLQKGFQIILLPGQQTTTTTVISQSKHQPAPQAATNSQRQVSSSSSSSSSSGRHHRDRASTGSGGSKSSHQQQQQQALESVEVERERTEYTMSIGRIFHKLALNGNTITVTHYRPRHPYPTIKIDYCYRFRAPFHETYGQSWVHFKSEKLENYNWNYLDNYICARGESTFALRSSLKFWRFRILILPSKLSLRKLEHATTSAPVAGGEQQHASHNNKLNGSEHGSHSGPHNQGGQPPTSSNSSNANCPAEPTRHDIFYQDYSDEECASLMESFIKLLEIINKTRRASACRLSSSSQGQQQPAGQCDLTCPNHKPLASNPRRLIVQIGGGGNLTGSLSGSSGNGSTDSGTDLASMNDGQSAAAAAKQGQTNGQAGREAATCNELQFESINMDIDSALRDAKRAEWVHVQYHNFYDVSQAFELIIKWMVASGAGIAEMVQSWSRKVGNSSVHVVPIPWEPFAMPHSGKADPLRCPLVIKLHLNCLADACSSLDDNQVINLQERILRLFGFVRFHDLISSENIERQYIHMSGFAFVALPNLISDQQEQQQQHTDSVEGTGPGGASNSSSSPKGETKQPSLVAQSANGTSASAKSTTTNAEGQAKGVAAAGKQGAPETGSQLVKGKQGPPASGARPTPLTPSLKLVHQETISSPHEEYITRHIGGARQNKANRLRGENEQIEFIWSWNYMLTKRWRSCSTQDESYAVSLMQDFKDFCANDANRLVQFWDEIKALV